MTYAPTTVTGSAERMPFQRLHELFNPRSIAIIGASPDPHRIRGLAQKCLVDNGFRGAIYPVNPSHQEVQGLSAYPNVASLPEVVDLALVGLPGHLVMTALAECHAVGIRNAIVFSATASVAANEDAVLHEEIADFASRTGMRIIGPNTEGFFNLATATAANFNPLVVGEAGSGVGDLRERRGISIISHSGGLAFGIYGRARRMYTPVRFVIGTGNESDVEALEVAEYLIREGKSTAILMFIEGFKRPERFPAVAAMAAEAGIPIIVMKTGRSSASRRAAVSHSGHLTGAETAYDALFDRYGVIRVSEPDEMVSIAAAFCQPLLPKGNRVCILTATGGTGAWVADLCAAEGLLIPETDPDLSRRIAELIPDSGAAVNPIDVTAAINDDGGVALSKVLQHIREAEYFDSVILIFGLAPPGRVARLRPVIETSLKELGRPVMFVSQTIPDPSNLETLSDMSIASYSFRGCAQGLRALYDYRRFQERWKQRSFEAMPRGATYAAPRDFASQRALLAAYGIPLVPEALVADSEAAIGAAAHLGYPLAVKIESVDLPHKSDIGGVVLNVPDDEALCGAVRRVQSAAMSAVPGANVAGVLLQAMAPPGVEMVLGGMVDPDFGPMVMLGFGGILVEILRDTVLAPCPIGPSEARNMIDGLTARALLNGVRGAPARDVDALVRLVVDFSRLLSDAGDDLEEVEFNPVIVHEHGKGVSVVDTLFVVSQTI